MPHFHLYGKILFSEVPGQDFLTNFANFLYDRAKAHGIWLNLWANLTEYPARKFDLYRCIEQKYLPYEILDDPFTNECYHIFDSIAIGEQIIVRNSRLPALEQFVASILRYDKRIDALTLCFEDVHGDDRARSTQYTIQPHQLCQTYQSAPRIHTELPNVIFTVLKDTATALP